MHKDVQPRVRRFSPRLDAHIRSTEPVPTIFWSTDAKLSVTSLQGTGLELLGLQPGALDGASLSDYFERQGPDLRFLDAHRRALRGETSCLEAEWGGRIFDAHLEPLRGVQDEILGVIGVARELAGSKRAEAEIRASERRLRALIENSSDMIALIDAGGTILYAGRVHRPKHIRVDPS